MPDPGDRVNTLFAQINKSVKQIFETIASALLTLPKLALDVLADPFPLIGIGWVLLIGAAWIWLGDFLLRHMRILRFILNVLNDVAIVVSRLFGIFGDSVEAAFNVMAKVANVGGKVVNGIGSLFGAKHLVPKIPTIPLTRFPVLHFEHFIKSLDNLHDASQTCAPFDILSYELAFPIRYALNNQVCPVVRYMTNTIVYQPFAWMMSLFYFDATPNGNNCKDSEAEYICFFLKFGYVLIYIMAPLMFIVWLLPAILGILQSTWNLAKDLLVLLRDLLVDLLHTIFHKNEKNKKKPLPQKDK